jgi:hypothetical protein
MIAATPSMKGRKISAVIVSGTLRKSMKPRTMTIVVKSR